MFHRTKILWLVKKCSICDFQWPLPILLRSKINWTLRVEHWKFLTERISTIRLPFGLLTANGNYRASQPAMPEWSRPAPRRWKWWRMLAVETKNSQFVIFHDRYQYSFDPKLVEHWELNIENLTKRLSELKLPPITYCEWQLPSLAASDAGMIRASTPTMKVMENASRGNKKQPFCNFPWPLPILSIQN